MRADIIITNIPTIMGIMGVMVMVITLPLDLATVTAESIMAVIQLIDGTMVDVIRLIDGITAAVMVVIEAVTAEALMVVILAAFVAADGMAAAFTVDIDKNGNIF
jgi:hypothetical protein